MLRALHIRDFVIVDQADIVFDTGFTVFSGETGAGKSILIDALALALGGRGDATLIRQDAARTDISAVFDAPEAAAGWLAEQALEGPELILRRVIDAQGRGKAWINGVPATLGQLRDLGALLVDIHGQHAHQSLLQPASQRELLDTQGGHADQARTLQQAWTDWRQAQAALDAARDDAAGQAALLEQLAADVAWLDELRRSPGNGRTCAPASPAWRTRRPCSPAPDRRWRRWTANPARRPRRCTPRSSPCNPWCATIPHWKNTARRWNRPASCARKPCPA